MFLNLGPASGSHPCFADVSHVSGLDFPDDGRAVAWVDWDGDGDLDLWTTNRNAPRIRLLRNELQPEGHWLKLRLLGEGDRTPRDAIGARVHVVLDNRSEEELDDQTTSLHRTLRAGHGFLCQSSKELHFGMGAGSRIRAVRVRWPGGDLEEFRGISPNGTWQLVQGTGVARLLPPNRSAGKLEPSAEVPLPDSDVATIRVIHPVPFPPSDYLTFHDSQRPIRSRRNRFLLLNVWSSTCPNCRHELTELNRRIDELEARGVDVLALCVDELKTPPGTRQDAASFVRETNLGFDTGRATATLLATMQNLHDRFVPLHRQMPLPASFLIDPEGQLSVIYKGPFSIDRLLEDLNLDPDEPWNRIVPAAALPGQLIDAPVVRQMVHHRDAHLKFRLATELKQAGLKVAAIRMFQAAVESAPNHARGHLELGDLLVDHGDYERAEYHFRRAMELEPDSIDGLISLGNMELDRRQYQRAEEYYRQAIARSPDSALAHFNLGVVLQRTNSPDEAIDAYRRAMACDPDFLAAKLNLVSVHHGQGDFQTAIELLKQFIARQPDEPELRIALGNVYASQQRWSDAVRQLELVIEREPDHTRARENLARIMARTRR